MVIGNDVYEAMMLVNVPEMRTLHMTWLVKSGSRETIRLYHS